MLLRYSVIRGTVLSIYDELYKNRHRIKHVLTAHEQGAAHAADGYSRASGEVSACIATSGPGNKPDDRTGAEG